MTIKFSEVFSRPFDFMDEKQNAEHFLYVEPFILNVEQ